MPICRRLALTIILGFLFLQGWALAQGFTGDGLIPPATYAVQDAPFTADIELVRTQTLPDRTQFTNTILSRVARDSAGRQRFEYVSGASTDVRIYDVVARKFIHLNDVDAVATIEAMGPTQAAPVRVPASTPIAWQLDTRPPVTSEKEKLPPQQIAGLLAEGTRTTYSVPAGRDGNESEVKVVDELWISPLYRMPLMRVHDDPRDGRTVIRVTEFTAGEPDAALFQVPSGYRVSPRPRRRPAPAAER